MAMSIKTFSLNIQIGYISRSFQPHLVGKSRKSQAFYTHYNYIAYQQNDIAC